MSIEAPTQGCTICDAGEEPTKPGTLIEGACKPCWWDSIEAEVHTLEQLPRAARTLEPGDAGWDRAWAEIARLYGDVECLNPESSEVWQYLSSALTPDGLVHEFRHRSLPAKAGARTYRQIPAEPRDFYPA